MKNARKITEKNFHIKTDAQFISCEMPTRKADYVSESGSKYFYTKEGVIRVSDHWGSQIATCNWHLDVDNLERYQKEVTREGITYIGSFYKAKVVAGFCKFEDFKYTGKN
jgi:hypothetical protein